MLRVASILFGGLLAGVLIISAQGQASFAAESASTATEAPLGSAVPDLLEAEGQQLVSVRYIPNNAKSAQIIVTNRTKRPLTLRLPDAFAGVPVLAQGGNFGGGGQRAGAGGNGGAQVTGGGGGGAGRPQGRAQNQQAPAGGFGGFGGPGGGAFSIPPERTLTFRVQTVCLEYGKPEPSTRMPYKLGRAEAFSSDPKLSIVLEGLGRGELSQKVAQAACWHIASGLTWEKLAAEKIDHAGGTPDEPYFSRAELLAAHRVVAVATELASRRGPPEPSMAPAKNGPAQ
jgi:hypothetical protein